MNERELFIAALQIEDPAGRTAYLGKACGDGAELRQRVGALLAAYEQAGNFLQQPAADPAVTTGQPLAEGPGTFIGPYKLLEQIGEGGFGVVFMAEQSKPIQRKVALKIIKPGMDTRQVIARFEAERQALALMDHPNIAKVLDAGTTSSGRPYFVMELVRGVPVTEYCDEKKLSIRERLELFITICQAVQHAHQKGIIHRDLKPTNVLVTQQDGRPLAKVIDFGVAKATGQKLTEKTLFTGFAQLIGTPLYMSPEQAELSAQDVDTRSDIYSLGVLLYELLTGSTPFDSERLKSATFDELRRIIREEEPPRPSTRLSTLGRSGLPSRTPGPARQAGPTDTAKATNLATVAEKRSSEPRHLGRLFQGELDWIEMKSLEKDRNRRYETASALAADVERYMNNEPVHARHPSVEYRMRKFMRRNRIGLAVTTAIGLALLITAGSAAWTLRDRSAREAVLEQQIGQAITESVSSYESDNLTEAMSALTRAQSLLASSGLRLSVWDRCYNRGFLAFRSSQTDSMPEVTQILSRIEAGDPSAAEQLLPLLYDELKKLAAHRLAHEKPGQTLQPTALVHEAYLRLVDCEKSQHWNSRGHFFAAAAEAMRRILVDNARRKLSLKQGGNLQRQPADLDQLSRTESTEEILAVDEALAKLAQENPAVAKLVKLKFFAGMTLEEAAQALQISLRTANRYWTYAKAYLHNAIHAEPQN